MGHHRSQRHPVVVTVITAILCLATEAFGRETSPNPERSVFVNVDLGSALDLSREVRSPPNLFGDRVEAYSVASFLIGINVGYRFNEIFGIEGGWHNQQHNAHPEWGGRAHYILGHASLRLAWPLQTRQTPVLAIGPVLGQFSYGSSSYGETADNNTLVVGGEAALILEHELTLGMVMTLKLSYLPLARLGMDGILVLEETDYTGDAPRVIGEKDFSETRLVHILWFTLGLQFEWTFF